MFTNVDPKEMEECVCAAVDGFVAQVLGADLQRLSEGDQELLRETLVSTVVSTWRASCTFELTRVKVCEALGGGETDLSGEDAVDKAEIPKGWPLTAAVDPISAALTPVFLFVDAIRRLVDKLRASEGKGATPYDYMAAHLLRNMAGLIAVATGQGETPCLKN